MDTGRNKTVAIAQELCEFFAAERQAEIRLFEEGTIDCDDGHIFFWTILSADGTPSRALRPTAFSVSSVDGSIRWAHVPRSKVLSGQAGKRRHFEDYVFTAPFTVEDLRRTSLLAHILYVPAQFRPLVEEVDKHAGETTEIDIWERVMELMDEIFGSTRIAIRLSMQLCPDISHNQIRMRMGVRRGKIGTELLGDSGSIDKWKDLASKYLLAHPEDY